MVERGIEEEPLVLELEVLVLLANAALAKGDELLPLSKIGMVFSVRGRGFGAGSRGSDEATRPGPLWGPLGGPRV